MSFTLYPLNFVLHYSEETLTPKNIGSSYLCGGAARELALHLFGVIDDSNIKVRDLDIILDPEDNSSILYQFSNAGEDTRVFSSIKSIMSSEQDVTLNKVLLGKEGLYIHRKAEEAIKNRYVELDKKTKKCALRAHFFAFRYSFTIKSEIKLDVTHPYFWVIMQKAFNLGILEGWLDYLKSILGEDTLETIIGQDVTFRLLCIIWNDSCGESMELEKIEEFSFIMERVEDWMHPDQRPSLEWVRNWEKDGIMYVVRTWDWEDDEEKEFFIGLNGQKGEIIWEGFDREWRYRNWKTGRWGKL